ncbi:MAG: hypothetical protein EBS54_04160 [Betaproteobacteria bacterium]|nr:hypothetical protein [Betaproteobacteria bacterium]NBT05954.1 hypothetical protein [Betaproteobacteria bacterium]NDE54443.1 hypothetical protein [Actinomycetota bacterium]
MDRYGLAAWLDYSALKLAARLPAPLALAACGLRALLRFSLNLEWRSYALKRRYVRQATAQVYARLQPKPSSLRARIQRSLWVLGRFWVESVEEFDVIRLERLGLAANRCQIKGLEGLPRDRGVVLLTAHWESLYAPLCHLAASGHKVYLAATVLVEDPQVPAVIREHFARKKMVLERFFGQGHVVYVEHGMASLVRALQGGAVVVIACDSPAPAKSRGLAVRFLGARVLMAQGPAWLAQAAGAELGWMRVERRGFGRYGLVLSWPQGGPRGREAAIAEAELLAAAFEQAYAALDAAIRETPSCWWAADLLLQARSEADSCDLERGEQKNLDTVSAKKVPMGASATTQRTARIFKYCLTFLNRSVKCKK